MKEPLVTLVFVVWMLVYEIKPARFEFLFPSISDQSCTSTKVHTTMMMDHKKLRRFLQDGHATFFVFELKDGHEWRKNLDNLQVFEKTLDRVSKEIKRNRNSKKDILAMLAEIQNKKKVAWMEGEQGWTTWVDVTDGHLH